MIRVAAQQRPAGNAVKREQQAFAPAVHVPVVADARGQRRDIAFGIVIVVDETELGHPSATPERARDGLEHGADRGAGILRIHRQDHDAAHVIGVQLVERRADRGFAVRHRQLDVHRAGQSRRELRRERLGDVLRMQKQRRSLVRPDFCVRLRRAGRAESEYDAVQDEPPEQPWKLDDPRIGKEFRQVAAHGGRRRRIRCTEIDEQDAERFGQPVFVLGRGFKPGH